MRLLGLMDALGVPLGATGISSRDGETEAQVGHKERAPNGPTRTGLMERSKGT